MSYRTQPKSWKGNQLFKQSINLNGEISKDTFGRTRNSYLDNFGGHSITGGHQLQPVKLKVVQKSLRPNYTHVCQKLNFLVIQKIKE